MHAHIRKILTSLFAAAIYLSYSASAFADDPLSPKAKAQLYAINNNTEFTGEPSPKWRLGLKYAALAALGTDFVNNSWNSFNAGGGLGQMAFGMTLPPMGETLFRLAMLTTSATLAFHVHNYLKGGFELQFRGDDFRFNRLPWFERALLATATAYGGTMIIPAAMKTCVNVVTALSTLI